MRDLAAFRRGTQSTTCTGSSCERCSTREGLDCHFGYERYEAHLSGPDYRLLQIESVQEKNAVLNGQDSDDAVEQGRCRD